MENQRKHYLEILRDRGRGRIRRGNLLPNLEGMIKKREELATLHLNIVVKVPCIEAGIKAIKYFTERASVRIVRWFSLSVRR